MGRLTGLGWLVAACGVAAVAAFGCSKESSPASPSPTPAPGGSNPSTATITISNNAVNPQQVTVAPGGRVTFVNNDTRAHDMASNPHPEHTDCPEINQVGFLQPGQSRTTGNLNTVRTCGFHDHNQDQNQALRGQIVIR